MCLCVEERESKRKTDREEEKERERDTDRETQTQRQRDSCSNRDSQLLRMADRQTELLKDYRSTVTSAAAIITTRT